jgi:hypothetical protein
MKKITSFLCSLQPGRAATVLRGKTGFDAKTVHGELYRFSKVDGDEEDILEDAPIDRYGQMILQFALRMPTIPRKSTSLMNLQCCPVRWRWIPDILHLVRVNCWLISFKRLAATK